MTKTPIHVVLTRIRCLPAQHKQAHLRGLIEAEQGSTDGRPNIHKTSVRIRELQSAACNVTTKQLRRERRA